LSRTRLSLPADLDDEMVLALQGDLADWIVAINAHRVIIDIG
jgi:anti-anti-sigma regulatory factor